jgi:hypothetical protein
VGVLPLESHPTLETGFTFYTRIETFFFGRGSRPYNSMNFTKSWNGPCGFTCLWERFPLATSLMKLTYLGVYRSHWWVYIVHGRHCPPWRFTRGSGTIHVGACFHEFLIIAVTLLMACPYLYGHLLCTYGVYPGYGSWPHDRGSLVVKAVILPMMAQTSEGIVRRHTVCLCSLTVYIEPAVFIGVYLH